MRRKEIRVIRAGGRISGKEVIIEINQKKERDKVRREKNKQVVGREGGLVVFTLEGVTS